LDADRPYFAMVHLTPRPCMVCSKAHVTCQLPTPNLQLPMNEVIRKSGIESLEVGSWQLAVGSWQSEFPRHLDHGSAEAEAFE
jgi:hypothetical protein